MLPEKLIINDIEYKLKINGPFEETECFFALYSDSDANIPSINTKYEDGIFLEYLCSSGKSKEEAIESLTEKYINMI